VRFSRTLPIAMGAADIGALSVVAPDDTPDPAWCALEYRLAVTAEPKRSLLSALEAVMRRSRFRVPSL
jgi:hypothetical protein